MKMVHLSLKSSVPEMKHFKATMLCCARRETTLISERHLLYTETMAKNILSLGHNVSLEP
jgi:hypothetical protein